MAKREQWAWITVHTRTGRVVHVKVPRKHAEAHVNRLAARQAKRDVSNATSGTGDTRKRALAAVGRISQGESDYARTYRSEAEDRADTSTRRGRGVARAVSGPDKAPEPRKGEIEGLDLAKAIATSRSRGDRAAALKRAARLAGRSSEYAGHARTGLKQGLADWQGYRESGATRQAGVATVSGKRLGKIRERMGVKAMTEKPHYKPKTQKNAKGQEGHWITWQGRHLFLRGARKVAGKERSKHAAGGAKPLEFGGAAAGAAGAAVAYRGAVKEGDRTRVIERARAAKKRKEMTPDREAKYHLLRAARSDAQHLIEKHGGTKEAYNQSWRRPSIEGVVGVGKHGAADVAHNTLLQNVRDRSNKYLARRNTGQLKREIAARSAPAPAAAPAQPSLKEQAAAHRAKKGSAAQRAAEAVILTARKQKSAMGAAKRAMANAEKQPTRPGVDKATEKVKRASVLSSRLERVVKLQDRAFAEAGPGTIVSIRPEVLNPPKRGKR